MIKTLSRVTPVLALIVLSAFSAVSGQNTNTPEVQQAIDAVRKVLDDSGRSFKEGMTALKANKRSESGAAFDKSVETFLFSTLDIQRNRTLQGCYNQLIETIYRLEFPDGGQQPQIRSLSATCEWRWTDADMKLADEVVAIARTLKPAASTVATAPGAGQTANQAPPATMVGFNEQGFEPSPRDELSRLELTQEELQVESNPEAQQQYQYIQVAVANKSLGFSVPGPPDDPAVHQLLSRTRPFHDGSWTVPLRYVHADGPQDLPGRGNS